MTISRSILLRIKKNVLDKSCRKIKTHFVYGNFFPKIAPLWDNVEKCGGARGATNDVTLWRMRVACWINKTTRSHAHADAHALGHPHTPTHTPICNTYCFSTATVVSWTRLSVTLYVHCLYCCNSLHLTVSVKSTVTVLLFRLHILQHVKLLDHSRCYFNLQISRPKISHNATRTCEGKSNTAMAKTAFSKKKTLFTSRLDSNLGRN